MLPEIGNFSSTVMTCRNLSSTLIPFIYYHVSLMTHDSWLMTHDSWLMTHDSWLMTHDSWLMTRISWDTRRQTVTTCTNDMVYRWSYLTYAIWHTLETTGQEWGESAAQIHAAPWRNRRGVHELILSGETKLCLWVLKRQSAMRELYLAVTPSALV